MGKRGKEKKNMVINVFVTVHDATLEEYNRLDVEPDENNGTIWKNLFIGSIKLTVFKPKGEKT